MSDLHSRSKNRAGPKRSYFDETAIYKTALYKEVQNIYSLIAFDILK